MSSMVVTPHWVARSSVGQAEQMDVGVDEARQQGAAAARDDCGAGRGGDCAGDGDDRRDHAAVDQHGALGAEARAVNQAHIRDCERAAGVSAACVGAACVRATRPRAGLARIAVTRSSNTV
jgi:hypothetical protein